MTDSLTRPDPWLDLRRHTPARIALGRTGSSLPTAEVLRFAAAHAAARDAVHLPLDVEALKAGLLADAWPVCAVVQSRAATREIFLRRPDLGRRLDEAGAAALQAQQSSADLAIILADGLSAAAVQNHALPLLQALRLALGQDLTLAPPVIATQARVALGDEVGELLGTGLTLMLIGERPGLSSPDSLGAYLTFAPAIGRSDAQRNCVSNIRPEGLLPGQAALRIAWLIRESRRLKLSGIALKDDSALSVQSALPDR